MVYPLDKQHSNLVAQELHAFCNSHFLMNQLDDVHRHFTCALGNVQLLYIAKSKCKVSYFVICNLIMGIGISCYI